LVFCITEILSFIIRQVLHIIILWSFR